MKPTTRIESVFFVGLGNAGQRHLRAFQAVAPYVKVWTAWRETGEAPVLGPDGPLADPLPIEAHYGLGLVDSLEEGLRARPNIVVIANPTALHAETIRLAVEQGLHVFCEQPLSDDVGALEVIEAICARTGGTCRVVLQKRHEPAFLRIGQLIASGALGEIKIADVSISSMAPRWRDWSDFRHLYACRAELGGGVVATECHELDLLSLWFGELGSLFADGGTMMSDLGVEDTVEAVLRYRLGALVHLHLGLCDPDVGRSIMLRGTLGSLKWDDRSDLLRHGEYDGEQVEEHLPSLGQEELYRVEAKAYLEWLAERGPEDSGMQRGITQARAIAALKLSLRTKQAVTLASQGLEGDWPDAARPAIAATVQAVEAEIHGGWRSIMAMGSLGYGGYVPGWSDCDIDVVLEEGFGADPDLASRLMKNIHGLGFPEVDIRCYRISELNLRSAPFPLGCVNRALMLKHSARVIAGEHPAAEVDEPSSTEVWLESLRVLDHLCGHPPEWWTSLPLDDVAAYIALPGRLLYTLKSGRVANKLFGLQELVLLARDFDDLDIRSAILWSLTCRYHPAAREVSPAALTAMGLQAAKLAIAVRVIVKEMAP
jgi:predicted dehydrogenase